MKCNKDGKSKQANSVKNEAINAQYGTNLGSVAARTTDTPLVVTIGLPCTIAVVDC